MSTIVCPCANFSINAKCILKEIQQDDLQIIEEVSDIQIRAFIEQSKWGTMSKIGRLSDCCIERILPKMASVHDVAGWKIYRCDYCNNEVYAENKTANEIIVSPFTQSREDFKPQEGFHFSKSLNMAIRDINDPNPDKLNLLYQTSNKIAWEEVTRISEKISHYINEEQSLMEKRISEFIRNENAAFEALKTAAIMDKKIIIKEESERFGWASGDKEKSTKGGLDSDGGEHGQETTDTELLESDEEELVEESELTQEEQEQDATLKEHASEADKNVSGLGPSVFLTEEELLSSENNSNKSKKERFLRFDDTRQRVKRRAGLAEPKDEFVPMSLPIDIPFPDRLKGKQNAKPYHLNKRLDKAECVWGYDEPCDAAEDISRSFIVPLSTSHVQTAMRL